MMSPKIIKLLMRQSELSLSSLSINMGIQKSTLSRILSGKTTTPSSETIQKIANYFSIPISELLVDGEENLKTSLKGDVLTNNLRTLMLNASILTAKDLSRATGIPTSNIERILNGTTNNPHLSTLNVLANYFNINISQLKGHEPLDNIFKGQISPLFCNVPILSFNNVTAWIEGKISQKTTLKFVKASRKLMGKKSFAIILDENYINDFKKNSILVVDSDINPDHGDYIIASARKEKPFIYEFSNDDTILLREVGKEEYIMVDVASIKIYGVVVEIKLKGNYP